MKICGRIVLSKHSLDGPIRISHANSADASLGCSDQQTSKWRVNDRVLNLQSSPALANRSRVHAEPACNFLVYSTSRREACVVERVVYCLPISQKTLHLREPASLHILTRRNP